MNKVLVRNLLVILGGAWFVAAGALFRVPPLYHHDAVVTLGGLTLVGGLWSIGDEQPRVWRNWLIALFGIGLTAMALLTNSAADLLRYGINVGVGVVLAGSAVIEALVSSAG